MLCHFGFSAITHRTHARQAAVAAVEAHQVQCLLYRDWIDVHEQCVHEVEILKRECLRRLEVARNGSGGKLVHFFRHDVENVEMTPLPPRDAIGKVCVSSPE